MSAFFRVKQFFGFALFLAFCFLPVVPDAADLENLPIRVEFSYHDQNIIAAVFVDIPAGYHAYAHDATLSGKPTQLHFSLGGGEALPVFYPVGAIRRDFYDASSLVSVYEGQTTFFITLPSDRAGMRYSLGVSLLLCSIQNCLPIEQQIVGFVPSSPLGVENMPWYAQWRKIYDAHGVPNFLEKFDSGAKGQDSLAAEKFAVGLTPKYADASLEIAGLGSALLVGILAGLLLNVMPCVLPVLVLKISGILAVSGGSSSDRLRRMRGHNLCFVAGVMTFFTALALILGITNLLWGQLYQNRIVLHVLIVVIFLLALSMLGVFTLPVIDLKFSAKARNPRLQVYLTGILSTFLATPCSGPLLGGVLGWAFTRSLPVIVVVFWAVGIGMSLPYLLLCFWPNILRILPKPGAWMLRFERIIGFCLLGTALYLFSILPADTHLQILGALLLMAFAAWLWGQYHTSGSLQRGMSGVACAVITVAAIFILWQPPAPLVQWRAFTPEYFSAQLGKKNLLLEFTADWCPNCKFLEAFVLTGERLQKWQNDFDVEFIRVDLTNADEFAGSLLEKLGSRSIPLTALFSVGDSAFSPLVLRDVYSVQHIEKSLNQTFTKHYP